MEAMLWKVQLWDENNTVGEWSENAFFEMGLLNRDDWSAEWIAGNYSVKSEKRYPGDCFCKDFTAEHIAQARLYITACGLYVVRINGGKNSRFWNILLKTADNASEQKLCVL